MRKIAALLLAVLMLLVVGCVASAAATKQWGAAKAGIPGCSEKEFNTSNARLDAHDFWWVACHGHVWRCRFQGAEAPECHPDADAEAEYRRTGFVP